MKAILSALPVLGLLTLSSCCSLFCPDEPDTGAPHVGTTPGNNVSVIITPTKPGQPQMYASWNLNGNATTGDPSGHRIWIGSDDQAFQIYGTSTTSPVPIPQGTTYALDISGMTSPPNATMSAQVKNQAAGTVLGTITPFEADGASSFTVVFRDALPDEWPGPANDELIMQIAAPGGGAKFVLTD